MSNQDINFHSSVLVVDDDHDIRNLLAKLLKQNDYTAYLAQNGKEMIEHLNTKKIDVIVLDVMMPGEDGLSLLKRLPILTSNPPPVIMLSAKGEDVDRILGLEMGSDDYLVKPFHPRELMARIKTVIRRNQQTGLSDQQNFEVVKIGPWLFDLSRRLLFAIDANLEPKTDSEKIREILKSSGEGMNTIEYRLLKALTDNPQRVLSRDFLLDASIGRQYVPTDRTIDVQMSRLRQKIRDNARNSELIKTIRYEGYMLTVAVQKVK